MPKNSYAPWGILLLFAVGCAKPQETIYIDLSSVPVSPQSQSVRLQVTRPERSISDSGTLPVAAKRNLLIGTGSGQAGFAIKVAKENQERAYKEALEDLTKSLTTSVLAKSREEKTRLIAKYRDRFDALYSDLRSVFDSHADTVGPKWVRLATVAGFPDKPSAKKKLPPASDLIRRKEAIEAESLRTDIAKLDADYRRRVSERIETTRQAFRLENSELEAQKVIGIAAAESEAERQAKLVAAEALKGLEATMINEIERVPEVAGSSVAISDSTVLDRVVVNDPGPEWTLSERLRDQAKLFCQTKGYRLADVKGGARDVTKEFLSWQRTMAGH